MAQPTLQCDYSAYSQGNLLSTASGHFIYSQTAHTDLNGQVWDAPAEGTQDFHADEDFHFYGQITPRGQDQNEALDDMTSKWIASEQAMPTTEPMRRIGSQSSSRSSKIRPVKPSSHKSRPRILSTVSQGPHMSDFDLSGNAMDGYLLADDAQSVASSTMYYPLPMSVGLPLDGLPTDGISYSPSLLASGLAHQHIDPAHMQLKFDPSVAGNSPSASWGSLSPESRISSPGVPEDTWSTSVPMGSSPTHTNDSSPVMDGTSPRCRNSLDRQMGMMTTEDINGHILADDMFALPPSFSRRPSNDGESSARDHPLYKNAYPKPDGLFHCPWEGQASCNHKPEKLKCNYDKFVDSHLKPYRCKAEACENARFSSTACLLRHEREAHAMHGHGDKPYLCTYDGCERAIPGNGFPRQWNLRDHMRRVHNDNGNSLSAHTGPPQPTHGSSTQSAKGRKRKNKDSIDSSSSSRKQASKSAQAAEAAAAAKAAEQPLIDEWYQHQKALQSYLQVYNSPDAIDQVEGIELATTHMTAMGKISRKLHHTKKSAKETYHHRRSYVHHAG
ncbi:hypothetical protein O1611_g351 [Lasiodiplodia mahajangana]|uniref:Uncharacterized protein n=1 Tax=Lasiodiplodia mahajangana TaxID=1108764 RepID=A0ACC2K0T9_9PEZI|nr:hypothetical protein O1611_g351 [Lasiodiplodia mahajangana]